jgi:acetyl esterase/lipase
MLIPVAVLAGFGCLTLGGANGRPVAPADAEIPKPIELWPKGAPGTTGDSDEDKPAIYPFLPPPDKNTGAAILVCPGGGFTTRCMDQEGVLVAQWLNARGIAAFALRYRIGPIYSRRESQQDAHRAMQYLRAHADEYHTSPDRIGIIGFSAGAELACLATFNPVEGKAEATDPLDRFPSRANFMILSYGSAPMRAQGAGNNPQGAPGSAAAPPTFMFCTAEDASHINGMITLYNSLRTARVPVEVHFFPNGEHGVAFAQGDPVLGTWPDLMFNWVRAGGFLASQKPVAVSGVVKVDGEPLPHGYVIFTPIDSVGAPPVTAYVLNTGRVRGQYSFRASQGPTPGRYRVEVRQDATRWQSNANNTTLQQLTQKARGGSDQDRQALHDYGRKRDLSPSIEGLRVYRKQRSTDTQDMIVEVKAAGENKIDLEVFSK